MKKDIPASNDEVLKSLFALAKDALRYPGAAILHRAYAISIIRRAAQRRQLPPK